MNSREVIAEKIRCWAKTKDNQKIAGRIAERIIADVYRLSVFLWSSTCGNPNMAYEALEETYKEELILDIAGIE